MKRKTARQKPRLRKKRRILLYAFLFLVVFLCILVTSIFSAPALQAVKGASSPDEILVKYKVAVPEHIKEKLRDRLKTKLTRKIGKLRVEVVKVPPGTVEESVRQFALDPNVEYAEPNFIVTKFAVSNDTSLSQQWGLFKINAANSAAASAWDVTTGGSTIKIAILDTGIEESHPDLSGKVVGSFNFTDSATADDLDGHGTHVAGIAAAATNNGNGVAGTGYNTVLLNGKVLNDNGEGTYDWVANGIIWAADQGADVISMSLGGSSYSQTLENAVNDAWSKGAVVIAAAGNNGNSKPSYPGYYQNVIAVAATDSNDSKASFSTYGSWVDVAAPGVNIYSTYKDNSYKSINGTSMATPFAAGTAALIWMQGSCSNNTCVRQQLEKTADQIAGTGSLWAWGRINAYKAVSGIVTVPTYTPTPTPTPVIAKIMTVSNINMSYTVLSRSTRRINATITVLDEGKNVPLGSATVKATITTPSGNATTYSSKTNGSGKVTFTLRSKERGTFITNISGLTKSSYTYHPTITLQSLLVQ
ncbi:MAG: S8 family serine peptidase [Candidatus Levybacteria bacterium]|nr:S8 family serine peptidase [Candidatus Levybacteria bacterium]